MPLAVAIARQRPNRLRPAMSAESPPSNSNRE
jgi:hypothetical protein